MQSRNDIRLQGSVKEKAAWEGEVWVAWERMKKQARRIQREAHTSTVIDKHTHTNRQRSHSHPRRPILRQTGAKMLYFPSKLKCQLILMWK